MSEVFVEVPEGQNARQAAEAALADQGVVAQPPPSAGGPGFTGLVWDALPVVQSYNPAGEPVVAESLLGATRAAWSSVPGSRFAIGSGRPTSRCPSIVRECPGPQVRGYDDVGWARLSGNILGVTWSTIGGVGRGRHGAEHAGAVERRLQNVAGSFDVQTVLLHENGHVAGLGHASSTSSVMFPATRVLAARSARWTSRRSARCIDGAEPGSTALTAFPRRIAFARRHRLAREGLALGSARRRR